MGIYTPPTETVGVEDLRTAGETCPAGCIPIVLGDLYIDFKDPQNKQEELIANLLEDIIIIDTPKQFDPQQPRKQSTRARWTWQHKRDGRTHYLQPDYIL
jgi:hypothetical protein